MKLKSPVSTIMTRSVISARIDQPLHEIKDMMLKHHIRHVPVVKDDKLVGMLSRTDIMRLSFAMSYAPDEENTDNAILDMLTTEQVMAGNVRSIDVNTTIQDAAQIFISEEFHALPVTEGGRLAGIVTTTDLLRAMIYDQGL